MEKNTASRTQGVKPLMERAEIMEVARGAKKTGNTKCETNILQSRKVGEVGMIKLESCPFCCGEAMVFVSGSVCVMCKKCHCQTFPRADGCISEAEKNNALESVINAWNRRPDNIAPYEYEGTWYCGNCNDPVNKNDKFCHECGRAVKWNDSDNDN